MTFTPEFQAYVDSWKNEDDHNNKLHAELTDKVNATPYLKAHRDFVEQNQYGFGDRPFGYVWKMLVDQMPQTFSFLEVGVFKGQILSLVALIAKESGKTAGIYGVTTLENTRDVRCQYPAGDYSGWIRQIHDGFNVSRPTLVVGKSNDRLVLEEIGRQPPFDLVYVDAGHDYADVVADIQNYAPKVKVGGFLVMDDSSNFLHIGSCWAGLEAVSEAVRDHLESDERIRHLFACGHLRIFHRIK